MLKASRFREAFFFFIKFVHVFFQEKGPEQANQL